MLPPFSISSGGYVRSGGREKKQVKPRNKESEPSSRNRWPEVVAAAATCYDDSSEGLLEPDNQ